MFIIKGILSFIGAMITAVIGLVSAIVGLILGAVGCVIGLVFAGFVIGLLAVPLFVMVGLF